MKSLINETKKIIDKISTEKLTVAKIFLEWLSEDEKLSKSELKKVLQGEKEIKSGKYISWREVARIKE